MSSESQFDEFVAAAEEAFARDSSDASLTGTGFMDLLAEPLADPDVRAAICATFLAHGRRLGTSAALFRLIARPYAEATGRATQDVAAGLSVEVRDGLAWVAVPATWDQRVLVDLVEHGVIEVEFADVRAAAHPSIDGGLVDVIEIDIDRARTILGANESEPAREMSTRLGCLAAAYEMLGATESILALGIDHARHREQFGQPIASFQAVRHLLAWASLDIQSGHHLCRAAQRALLHDDDMTCRVAKAVVGRNGRRAADRVAQVLGGMGFTWEHSFHTFHRRILVLDSLFGGSTRVMDELGRAALGDGDPANVLPLVGQVAQGSSVERERA